VNGQIKELYCDIYVVNIFVFGFEPEIAEVDFASLIPREVFDVQMRITALRDILVRLSSGIFGILGVAALVVYQIFENFQEFVTVHTCLHL
jgi:hypothetical protein